MYKHASRCEPQVGVGAPDCYQRNVLLVSGTFQPTIEVVQGSLLQVKIQSGPHPVPGIGISHARDMAAMAAMAACKS